VGSVSRRYYKRCREPSPLGRVMDVRILSTLKVWQIDRKLPVAASWRTVWQIKTNSVASVCERTIPTERQPLVGGVSANFCGWMVPCGQRDGSLRPYSRFSWQEPLFLFQVAPQLYSRGWVDPVPDPLILRKYGSAVNRTRISGFVAKNSDQ
jgi:hypothetical protein